MSRRSSKAFSAWTVSLIITTEAGGLRASVRSVPTQFHAEQTQIPGNNQRPPLVFFAADLLRRVIPTSMDLSDVAKEFHSFENSWQFCYPRVGAYSPAYPVFNCRGDLLFELRPQPQAPQPRPQTPRLQPQAPLPQPRAPRPQPQAPRLRPQVPRPQPQATRPHQATQPPSATTTNRPTRDLANTYGPSANGGSNTHTTRIEREGERHIYLHKHRASWLP